MPVLVQVLGQHWANTFRQYWPNAEPLLPQHWANTTCRYWASTGPIHCASTGPMLNHYYPSIGPIQLAGTGPLLGQYIAPALAQCWTSIGPTLGQYHMPALARFTAAVQRMHWAHAVYTGLRVLAQYWPNTVMFAGYAIPQISHINPPHSYLAHARCVHRPHSPQYIQLSHFLLLDYKSEQHRQGEVSMFSFSLF